MRKNKIVGSSKADNKKIDVSLGKLLTSIIKFRCFQFGYSLSERIKKTPRLLIKEGFEIKTEETCVLSGANEIKPDELVGLSDVVAELSVVGESYKDGTIRKAAEWLALLQLKHLFLKKTKKVLKAFFPKGLESVLQNHFKKQYEEMYEKRVLRAQKRLERLYQRYLLFKKENSKKQQVEKSK